MRLDVQGILLLASDDLVSSIAEIDVIITVSPRRFLWRRWTEDWACYGSTASNLAFRTHETLVRLPLSRAVLTLSVRRSLSPSGHGVARAR